MLESRIAEGHNTGRTESLILVRGRTGGSAKVPRGLFSNSKKVVPNRTSEATALFLQASRRYPLFRIRLLFLLLLHDSVGNDRNITVLVFYSLTQSPHNWCCPASTSADCCNLFTKFLSSSLLASISINTILPPSIVLSASPQFITKELRRRSLAVQHDFSFVKLFLRQSAAFSGFIGGGLRDPVKRHCDL